MGLVEEFPRVEDALWVQGIFDLVVEVHGSVTECLSDPWFFGQADTVFTADDAAVTDDPAEEFIEGGIGFLFDFRVGVILHHDVGVDIAVSGVAEACDGDTGIVLQFGGEIDQTSLGAVGHSGVSTDHRIDFR